MSQKPYDYSNRQGVRPISWEDFHGICKALAEAAASFQTDIILPVGRGGYYPGVLLAHILQVEIYPVRISRRVKDTVIHNSPKWIVEPPAEIAGKRVLVVDEICSSGETLLAVKQKAVDLGAAWVKCAVMYSHSWGSGIPDYIGIISDALVINPWDREIFKGGKFQLHPEYAKALESQGMEADDKWFIPAKKIKLAKG